MRRRTYLVVWAILATWFGSLVTRAVQAQQTPSPETQALATKLMAEINTGLQCSSNLIVVQQALEKATAEVKRLKDKYEVEQK